MSSDNLNRRPSNGTSRKSSNGSTTRRSSTGSNVNRTGSSSRNSVNRTGNPAGNNVNRTGSTSGKKPSGKKKNSKKAAAARKRKKIILFAVEIAVLAILCVVFWIVTQGVKADKVIVDEEVVVSQEVQDKMNSTVVVNDDGSQTTIGELYTQVALFGVDSTEGELSKNTRTDTIIIASINNQTGEVKLCSVYRDTYLNLSNDQYNKCNSAYAFGGAPQAIQMLNMNLDLNITDYITVGFKGVVDAVDSLGGIELDLTSEEIRYLNDYQYCIAENLNRSSQYVALSTPGMQLVNGLQACGYCRIRYTAGDDYKRTERQRTVINLLLEKSKTVNPTLLTQIVTDSFANVSTSFDLGEILSYTTVVGNYTIVGSEGFPFTDYRTAGTIGSKGSCVVPLDLTTNVVLLHEYLFGVQDYDPTDTVKQCSEQIKSDTSQYL